MDRKLLLGIAVVMAAGCGGPKHYFTWKALPAAPSVAGKMAIEVHDKRDPKKGGDDTRAVGLGTGSFGIPQTIRLNNPSAVAMEMADYLSQAALAAGIGVAAPGDPAPTGKMVAEIQQLWCSGYAFVFKADVTMSIMVVDPASGAVRMAAVPFHTDDGDSDCRGAYRKALTKGFEAAVAVMNQMKPAATGAAAAAPAAPAAQ